MADYTNVPAATVAVAGKHEAWAFVRDGVVQKIVRAASRLTHPFSDEPDAPAPDVVHGGGVAVPLHGVAVVRVTNSDAAPGMLVDEKGNVTPSEGRTRALLPGEPAYHAPNVVQTENVEGEDHTALVPVADEPGVTLPESKPEDHNEA